MKKVPSTIILALSFLLVACEETTPIEVVEPSYFFYITDVYKLEEETFITLDPINDDPDDSSGYNVSLDVSIYTTNFGTMPEESTSMSFEELIAAFESQKDYFATAPFEVEMDSGVVVSITEREALQ